MAITQSFTLSGAFCTATSSICFPPRPSTLNRIITVPSDFMPLIGDQMCEQKLSEIGVSHLNYPSNYRHSLSVTIFALMQKAGQLNWRMANPKAIKDTGFHGTTRELLRTSCISSHYVDFCNLNNHYACC